GRDSGGGGGGGRPGGNTHKPWRGAAGGGQGGSPEIAAGRRRRRAAPLDARGIRRRHRPRGDQVVGDRQDIRRQGGVASRFRLCTGEPAKEAAVSAGALSPCGEGVGGGVTELSVC